ncbi:uncharacterized protein ColSpa_05120 [Colletotrichum spaethianum]|uniref:RING finger domain-containing protein n=1 Tax=Colletotrichum spaethianum TaxID=700344 RepID=A0AA37LEF9_9PEZI|nr:uncharacterized protein ColSpa_05120 [Colletotrichum spaethianum]GKT44939.1 hypothetical protein ColSpa_05120 [Colletotrichum spaethianum]
MDDVPPPPYSETDIYSTSGQRSNPSSISPHVPSNHGDDGASRVSSHASSRSEVIYTPPLTPRTSGTGGAHQDDSSSSLSGRPQAFTAPSTSSAYSDFAAAYFESRPAPAFPPQDQLVHLLTVTPSSTPDDVPCPPSWAARDVTQQDWATFTNCLIPHHTAARNEAVINRKLRAEEEAIAAAAAASNGGGATTAPAARGLDQIRSDPDTDPGAAAAASGLRREDVEAVVAQWNEGFFHPRGVAVMLNPDVEELRVPGAWDRSFDRSVESPTIPGGGGSGGPTPVPFPVHTGPGPTTQSGPSASEARGSWSFGGITVTQDGISIGDRIVADSNGIRVGNLIADENGIRFGSNTTPRAQPHYVGPNPNWAPPPLHAPPGPSPVPMFGPGPGSGPFPPGPHPQHMALSGTHEHPFFQSGHNHAHVRHGSGSGGRGRPPGRYPSDQRSVSASSSASSSSSTSSASSVGSLPDYEDLYPAQLPIYKHRVASWLSHPDQPVTKADVAQLRKEIRSARSVSDASGQSKQDNPSAASAPSRADEKALRAELKTLTQEWRKLKRQQRTVRKEKRRERRAKRREEKRERREQRRERREQRREGRRAQMETRRGGGGDGGDGGDGARGGHQHHHHHHHGPGPMPAPSLWGAPQPFVPPPPHGIHVPPPPVVHTPPIPVVPIVSPNVPNNFQWGGGPGRGFAPRGGFSGGGGPWGAGFGRGWGRGHGRGSEHAFPSNAGPPHPPGAWPVGGGGERSPGASTPPVPPSQVLFKAVEEMEKDIARRVEELDKVRNEMRDNNPRRGRCGNSRGRGRCGSGRAGGGDETAQKMEAEIDELSRNVEKLKIEADAEFARELAAEDDKSGGW